MRAVAQRWDVDADQPWQETDYESGWTVREEWSVQHGRHVVTTLTIRPATKQVPAGGINSRLLRGVQVGRFGEMLRQMALKFPIAMAGVLAWFKPPKRRRRWARNGDRFYAELARDYVNVWTGRIPTAEGRDKPTEALAKLRGVQLKLLRSQIHLARKNEFLSDGKQGKAGGTLTKRAETVLSRKEN
jgi:hypothetical protein